jgi:D-psicose/D-tagatose/L-ribulose 3-epimerase
MPATFRHAICNEIYQGWELADACRSARAAGYTGIEIAPFTLSEDPASLSAARRAEYRRVIAEEGLAFVGLHWLMVAPKGLHLTTPDDALRARSWRHIESLIGLCASLGPGGVMVLGSPLQRGTTAGSKREEAVERLTEGLAAAAPSAAAQGVTILIEALPLNQCDVVNTLDEAAAIVRAVDNPGLRTMFDSHNAVDEREPHSTVIERHFDLIRHVHLNETDGGHCGTGDYDFAPVLAALSRLSYAGWLSLEAFDFSPGPEKIARDSIRHLGAIIEKL